MFCDTPQLAAGSIILAVVGMNGEVLAWSRPTQFPKAVGSNVSRYFRFKEALATTAGDQYAVDDIMHDVVQDGRLASVFAATVRQAAKVDGKRIGVLGVVFAWGAQAWTIVRKEAKMSASTWRRSRVMLVDNNLRVIALSDDKGLLQPFMAGA